MLNDDLQKDLDRLIDGDLTDEERSQIASRLEDNSEAIDWLADRAWMHANLRKSINRRSIENEILSQHEDEIIQLPKSRFGLQVPAIAAALALLFVLSFLLRDSAPKTIHFATLEETHSALWKGGDLPTSSGSRLGEGTLRLVEGLATLRFDSGALVTLEAPATLVLKDQMNCELKTGTAVSDIPDSALGFRIKTPSADVVDYGTRFAVSVYEDTGETHTQVMEGRVQVEYAESDRIVELRTGQRNVAAVDSLSAPTEEPSSEYRTIPVSPMDHDSRWTLIETTKDAYTGLVKGHESSVLLYVKNAVMEGPVNRTSYLGFDLKGIDKERIEDTELVLSFAPTGWGLASYVPDATFSVHGVLGESPDWDESILHDQFPGAPEMKHLGSFTIPQGVQRGRFRIRTELLTDFLANHASNVITLQVVRDTKEIEDSGLVHGFASRRHPILPAPTLAIRYSLP